MNATAAAEGELEGDELEDDELEEDELEEDELEEDELGEDRCIDGDSEKIKEDLSPQQGVPRAKKK